MHIGLIGAFEAGDFGLGGFLFAGLFHEFVAQLFKGLFEALLGLLRLLG